MKQSVLGLFFLFCVSICCGQSAPEGLFINSKAPDFNLKDQEGKNIRLKDLLKKYKNVVVIFYRGHWDPACMKELKAFQDSLSIFDEKQTTIVAITAENNSSIDSTIAKTGVSFPLLFDDLQKNIKAYQVASMVSEKDFNRMKQGGIDLVKINGEKNKDYLPIPAVYVVNRDMSVTYRYFNAQNIRKRPSVKEVFESIK